ncbi:GumC family protein [Qipengyuania spongiae]|uniref:non-specific protein-tyrosine kinase n=1 Tax=Qipengyuania spongiae TaxID=2909673 RepID=A0ABY5T2A7_9SPHN|nr:polysaccharide biosynthesis tyrosine autokinase [Qipengyuania spongiae]UVI39079.1 polysaccharide biosynthesis tyrosine autokinase [Qipengyuania spongiae]
MAGAQKSAVPLLPDPGLVWQAFRRNLLLFVAVVGAVLALTAAYLATAPRIYRAQSSILIQPTSDPVETTEPGDARPVVNADQVDTEIRLIQSPFVSEIAARNYAQNFASPDGDRFTEEEITALAGRMNAATIVARSGQSRVVDVIAQDTDPSFAASAANLVAEAYLQSQVRVKVGDTETSASFINARLSELESNALTAQAALDNYRAERGLISGTGGTNAEQEVSALNQQLAVARADLAEKRGRYNAARQQLSRGGGGADVGAALGSGTISGLRAQEATVSAQVAVLRERYGELYPERRQAEQELREIRQRIQEEINRVLSNLDAEVQTAQSRVSSLEGSRAGSLGALTVTGRAQTQLNELQQKADVAQAIYRSFLNRSQETEALRDSALPDARISARATVPRAPSSPNIPLTVLIGGFLAFVGGFGAVGTAEYLRRGIQTRRDVEKQLGLRYAGAVPTLKSAAKKSGPLEAPQDYVLQHPHSLFTEAFRSIRTFLSLSPGKRARVIAITSALPREGKTTTAACLARSTAAEGIRTVLVDADLRRRGSSEIFGFDHEHDIHDLLAGTASLADCVVRDEASGLDVLGSSNVDRPLTSITEERVERLLEMLRENYDVAIIDTAPVLGVAESRVWTNCADRILLLSQWKKTSVRAVDAAASMLIEAGGKITGLAVTQVDIRKYASTGDGDVYGYAKKFRGYYTD